MIVTLIVSEQVPHESREVQAQTQFVLEQTTPQLVTAEIGKLRERVMQEIREVTKLPDGVRACTDGKIRVRRR